MMRKDTSPICVQSKTFALHMVGLYRLLSEEKKEFVLSKQVLRSGTSIGANVHEAVQAQSRADFLSKLSIALKEACETEYWLEILMESSYVSQKKGTELMSELKTLLRMLTSSIKTAKANAS